MSGLDLQGTETLPCELDTKADAQDALDAIAVSKQTVQYCVISSADKNLGCFIDRDAAEQERRATGQQRLLSVIGQTARLEQRPVLAIVPPSDPTYTSLAVTCPTAEEADTDACSFDTLDQQEVVYMDAQKNKFRLGPTVISGSDITKATAVFGGSGVTQWQVSFELGGDAVDAFAEATTTAVSQPPPQNSIAIVVDRAVISYPTVNDPITNGNGVISGGFDETEAKDLATVLNAGALPVELTRQSVQTVSPTLGEESLRQGIVAGIAGLILLFLYLLFYYRLLGIVAWFGMSAWAILALAIVSLAGAQVGYALTLAGVAGLVISLGVTADSYIVFFERLKDEVRSGKSARSAVQPAFKRSYKTIVAADFVTMIAAVVLYVTAVSSVRGFALTLGVATLLDLFVVYFFKRPTVFLIARNERLVNMHGFGLRSGIAGDPDPETRRREARREPPPPERDLSRPHDPALPVRRAQAALVHDLGRRDPAGDRRVHRPRWAQPVDRLRGRRADRLPAAVRRHRPGRQRHPRRQRPARRRGADRERGHGLDPYREPGGRRRDRRAHQLPGEAGGHHGDRGQHPGHRTHVGRRDLAQGAVRARDRADRDHDLHLVPVRVEDGGRARSSRSSTTC